MNENRLPRLLTIFIVITLGFLTLISPSAAQDNPPPEASEPLVEQTPAIIVEPSVTPTDVPPSPTLEPTPLPPETLTIPPAVEPTEPPPVEIIEPVEPTPDATVEITPEIVVTPIVETAPDDVPLSLNALLVSPLVVTHTEDSGEGSLREALNFANDNPGTDTITFNIPGDEPHTIQPSSPLPEITDALTIDGTSQPGATCDVWPPTLKIELQGSLVVDAENSTVRGLVINSGGLNLTEGNASVQCNFIGTDVTGTVAIGNGFGGITIIRTGNILIGGVGTGIRNLISGNEIGIFAPEEGVGNLTIQGNYIGTDVTGQIALGNTHEGISVDTGFNITIGGTAPGAGNLISGNGTGIFITYDLDVLGGGFGGTIQGNYIGTNASGTAAIPNGTGLSLVSLPMIVGGTEPGARNLISGNDVGISVYVEDLDRVRVASSQVIGNYIGTDITGTQALGNGVGASLGGKIRFEGNVVSGNVDNGVSAGGSSTTIANNTIGLAAGGTQPLGNGGDGIVTFADFITGSGFIDVLSNTIAHNGGNGITVNLVDPNASTAIGGNSIVSNDGNGITVNFVYSNAGTTIGGNSIVNNGKLGIDLGNDGVTLNDPGDSDQGANGLQNFPVITSAITGATSVSGTINTLANADLTLEFFIGTCDPSGYGEGALLIGSTTVHTDASGNASFSAPTTIPLIANHFVTAAVVSGFGPTEAIYSSEFSACAPVTVMQSGPPAPTLVNPGMDAQVTLSRPSFTWSSVSGANRYRLQVSTTSNFSTVVIQAESDFTSAGPGILPQGVYYWRVQARDPRGNWGAFSAFRRFELNIMQSPARATDTTSTQPSFHWYAYAGAIRYQVQVDNAFDFSSPEFTCERTYKQALSCSPIQPLLYGDYVWRVNVDTGQGFVPSPFMWRFSVRLKTLLAPGLIAPANNATVSGTPTFSWSAVTGATFYQIEISDNRDFINLRESNSVNALSYTLGSTLPSGVYYWRVRAMTATFQPGGWSGVRSFRVG